MRLHTVLQPTLRYAHADSLPNYHYMFPKLVTSSSSNLVLKRTYQTSFRVSTCSCEPLIIRTVLSLRATGRSLRSIVLSLEAACPLKRRWATGLTNKKTSLESSGIFIGWGLVGGCGIPFKGGDLFIPACSSPVLLRTGTTMRCLSIGPKSWA